MREYEKPTRAPAGSRTPRGGQRVSLHPDAKAVFVQPQRRERCIGVLSNPFSDISLDKQLGIALIQVRYESPPDWKHTEWHYKPPPDWRLATASLQPGPSSVHTTHHCVHRREAWYLPRAIFRGVPLEGRYVTIYSNDRCTTGFVCDPVAAMTPLSPAELDEYALFVLRQITEGG